MAANKHSRTSQKGLTAGEKKMTAIGPAGFTIIAFVGFVSALAGVYSIEQIVRRALGQTQRH